MITKAYAIYDTKGLVYNTPFFALQNGVAVRMFTELVNDGRSNISRFPDDFILYEVGSYDDSNGKLATLSEPVNLGHASAFVKDSSKEVVR